MNVDERFAARGMADQDLEFPTWRKALGALPGLLLCGGFLRASWAGDLSRAGFDLWLAYAAVALGVFIFPRSMRFAVTAMACVAPAAVAISAVRHPWSAAALAAGVGLSCWLVRALIPIFRPEPFAPKWPTQ